MKKKCFDNIVLKKLCNFAAEKIEKTMKQFGFSLFFLLLFCVTTQAQENKVLNLQVEARGDYQREYVDGEAMKDNSGFKGKYFTVNVSGDISEKFSYKFSHRLNKYSSNSSFFDATDVLYVDYKPTDAITLSAGKQVVLIGGYEYDRAPIDLYFCSEYWHNVPCYMWGGSVEYKLPNEKDKFLFQFCESPFRSYHPNSDMYSYNLAWYGTHGFYNAIWSLNMLEYAEGKYISYLALGNEFCFNDKVKLQLDFMNRASSGHSYFFKNCSFVGELSYRPIEQLNIFAKASYDVNHTNTASDYCVMDNTELTSVGGGIEYFPLPNHDFRLHANGSYTWGKNGNPDGVLQNKQTYIDFGMTWKMDIWSLKR